MFKKIIAGVILLVSLDFCVAAAPAADYGAKKPSRLVKHTSRQKNHRLARAVKAGVRHRAAAASIARLRPAHSGAAASITTAAHSALSDEFRRQKGHLAWPLAGTISMSFGPHKYINDIIHNNQGVTIDCAEGAVVRAVYTGEVTAVLDIAGVWCVILKHGSYYTAYSNLVTTSVVQGDQVQPGDSLGRVGDIAQLEFMLSDEDGRFYDPGVWLRK
jgi:septal ring factor EnvC (AmiA/AmiB activator)